LKILLFDGWIKLKQTVCNYYEKIMKREITRAKEHIMTNNGNVRQRGFKIWLMLHKCRHGYDVDSRQSTSSYRITFVAATMSWKSIL